MVNQEYVVDSCACIGTLASEETVGARRTRAVQAPPLQPVLSVVIRKALCFLIRLYQNTRLFRPSCCRFYPSCSDYCLQAIETHGMIRGIVLTLRRLLKCHPWHSG